MKKALIVAAYLAAAVCCRQVFAQRGPQLVVVAKVVERQISDGRTFVGTVLPSRKSVVGSAVDGRVVEFLVNDGDRVKKDQPLAKLRTGTLEIELASARAQLELRQHELTELENGSRPEELAKAKAALERAKVLLNYAKLARERKETLFKKGGTASLEELELARSTAEAAEQTLLVAQADYELAVQGPRKEKIQQAQAKLAIQQGEVARLEDRLKKYTIRAPFDGYVTAELTEVGEWVTQAKSIAEVVAIDPVEISVAVPGSHAVRLKSAASASVRLDALDNKIFTAKIARVVPQAEIRSRTFPVKIKLANPTSDEGHLIKVGMMAKVTLAVGSPQKAVLVPKDALVLGGRSPVVYVVASDAETGGSVANVVPVELGSADGSWIQVKGALDAGQQVVVKGNERLRPGAEVKVAE